MKLRPFGLVAGLLAAWLLTSAHAQDTGVMPGDTQIVRVWDCDANWIAKGWAISNADCNESWKGLTARQALDKFLSDNQDLKNYEIVGFTIKQVPRGGILRTKMWTVYDFQLRPKQKQ